MNLKTKKNGGLQYIHAIFHSELFMQLKILLGRPYGRLQRLRKPFPSLENNFSRNKVTWFLLLFGDHENWCQPWCDWRGRVTSPLMGGGSGNWVNVAVTSKLAPSSEKRKEWSSTKRFSPHQHFDWAVKTNICMFFLLFCCWIFP